MQLVVAVIVFLSMAGYHIPLDEQDHEKDEYQSKYLAVVENLANLDITSAAFAQKCVILGSEPPNSSAQILDLLEYLSTKSEESNALLQFAVTKQVKICVDDITWNERGFFDHEQNLIVLRDVLTFPEQVVILIHELRHLDQFSRGFCPSVQYDISEFVRLTYALEADAQAVTTLLAWMMKENGVGVPWDTLTAFPNYRDIAESFSSEYMENQNLQNATNAAFAQWYHSDWRLQSYYNSACSSYLEDLEEMKLIQSYGKLPDTFFNTLCTLPDGSNYDCLKNPEINIVGPAND